MATLNTRLAKQKAAKEAYFAWEGKDKTGKLVRGEMRAVSETVVNSMLRRQGILVLKLKKRSTAGGKSIQQKDIAVFTRQLATMTKAVDLLVQQGAVLKNTSDVYETPPWGNVDQPAFFNRVIEIGFLGEPEELLSILLSTENQLGRVRTVHWGPRVMDIDLLAFGSEVILGQRLTVPHPLLRDRAFVLVPWAEIAPDFIVPNINQTVQELLEQLPAPERAAIQRLPRS